MERSDNDLSLRISWDEAKEKIKEANPLITDDDLDYPDGHVHKMLQRVGDIIGKDPAAAKAWIESVAFNEGIAS
jgi:hypothetical protein